MRSNSKQVCPGFSTARVQTQVAGLISVEVIVAVSVAALTLMIFGLIIVAAGESKRSERSTLNPRGTRSHPHDAVTLDSGRLKPTSEKVATVALEDGKRKPEIGESQPTFVRDGVTVVTPKLLVPVVHLNDQSVDLTP